MAVSYEWRGLFENAEVNTLHTAAFETRVSRNWQQLLAEQSLGWVVARDGTRLVGFVNVVWDGSTHAWLQDTMVAETDRRRGIGTRMIELVHAECRRAGCAWLHVDFEEELGRFYFQSCGFTPTTAGLLRLT
jgi:GNAT superfamily N-acetyltransferase